MIYPPLDELLKHVDSRYTLVTVAAKLARKILEEDNTIDNERAIKAVSIALHDVADGNIKVERMKAGIK